MDMESNPTSSSSSSSLGAGQYNVTAAPQHSYKEPARESRSHSMGRPLQTVSVVTSKFSLPPDCVESVYPAPGTDAEAIVLPHIVLKDSHLPWAGRPTYIAEDERRGSPWLALLAFTTDELSVEESQLETIMAGLPADVKRNQSETFALQMRARDTRLLEGVTNTISYNPDQDYGDAEKPVDVLLLAPALFTALFSAGSGGPGLCVSGYKHLAHVRPTQMVAEDTVAAGGTNCNPEDMHTASVVVSPRTSAIGSDIATTTVVHLVSLDMKSGLTLPLLETQRVALVSLHSWTYTCVPTKNSTSTAGNLLHLGESRAVASQHLQSPVPGTREMSSIEKRFAAGYTLVRHRTVTGEVTSALCRGPLTPTPVPHPLQENLVVQSNSGVDLQILDSDTSLLDVTYSTAWQLGRALALHDMDFSIAFTRLRSAIHGQILRYGKQEEHKVPGGPDFDRVYSWVLGKLDLADIPVQHLLLDPSCLPEESASLFFIDENWTDALVDGAFSLANHMSPGNQDDMVRTAIKKAVRDRLNTPDTQGGGRHLQMPQCGFLLRSQVLVEFPEIVVQVRFSADDGAKSSDEEDSSQPPKTAVVVQRCLTPQIIYCSLDCILPAGLNHITLTLPANQQRFVVGQKLDSGLLKVQFKNIGTTSGSVPLDHKQLLVSKEYKREPGDEKPIFNWDLRMMNVDNYGQEIIGAQTDHGKKPVVSTELTSGVLALQLSHNPILELVVGEWKSGSQSR